MHSWVLASQNKSITMNHKPNKTDPTGIGHLAQTGSLLHHRVAGRFPAHMKHMYGSFTQGIGIGLRLARLLVVAGGLALGSRALAQATLPPEIEDPECLGINK